MAEADAANGGHLGELLKNTREARGISLDQASKITKISRGYLAALEAGELDKLPSPAYVKGFIRLYAGYLGLNPAEVVGLYERSAPSPAAHQEEAHPPIEMVERVKFGRHGRWAVPALLLCLVILAALFLSEPERRERPAPPPVAVVPKPVQPPLSSAKAAQPVLPQVSSARAPQPAAPPTSGVQPAAPAQVFQPTGAPHLKGVMLRLRFTRDSALSITIDGNITQHYDLKAGDVIEWKGEKQFSLDLSDGGAVEAEFNGRPLKALGEPAKPVHVELKG